MSCGTNTCTSIRYDIPAAMPFAGYRRLRQRLLAWSTAINGDYDRWRQRRQLLELDDRLLADIGVSRQQAREEAHKSSWTGLTLWRIYR